MRSWCSVVSTINMGTNVELLEDLLHHMATWLLDSLFLYIAASNCSVNIAESMSERRTL